MISALKEQDRPYGFELQYYGENGSDEGISRRRYKGLAACQSDSGDITFDGNTLTTGKSDGVSAVYRAAPLQRCPQTETVRRLLSPEAQSDRQ